MWPARERAYGDTRGHQLVDHLATDATGGARHKYRMHVVV
jgi:hypothetical protein